MRSLMPGLGPGVLGLKQKLSLLLHSSKSVSGGSVTLSPRAGLRGEPAAEVLVGLVLGAPDAATADPDGAMMLPLQLDAARGADAAVLLGD